MPSTSKNLACKLDLFLPFAGITLPVTISYQVLRRRSGGFKVQGKTEDQAKNLINTAKHLEEAGAAMLLIECVPSIVATQISQSVSIPVIGIGAGADTDAQVLVLHDMLGLNDKPAKFVKNFMEGQSSIESAIKEYVKAVKEGSFPSEAHQYI